MSYNDYINGQVDQLIAILNDLLSDYHYTVRAEYSDTEVKNAILAPVLTVGVHSIAAAKNSFSRFIGYDENTDLTKYGEAVEITYRVTVHCPVRIAQSVCQELAATVLQGVKYELSSVGVSVGSLKYDSQCRAVTMPIDIVQQCLMV